MASNNPMPVIEDSLAEEAKIESECMSVTKYSTSHWDQFKDANVAIDHSAMSELEPFVAGYTRESVGKFNGAVYQCSSIKFDDGGMDYIKEQHSNGKVMLLYYVGQASYPNAYKIIKFATCSSSIPNNKQARS